jgi:hypothetical protein
VGNLGKVNDLEDLELEEDENDRDVVEGGLAEGV